MNSDVCEYDDVLFQIHTSLINGRPSADDPSPTLLNFTSARFIRLRFQRIRTLNADLMTLALNDPRDIDPIVTRRVCVHISPPRHRWSLIKLVQWWTHHTPTETWLLFLNRGLRFSRELCNLDKRTQELFKESLMGLVRFKSSFKCDVLEITSSGSMCRSKLRRLCVLLTPTVHASPFIYTVPCAPLHDTTRVRDRTTSHKSLSLSLMLKTSVNVSKTVQSVFWLNMFTWRDESESTDELRRVFVFQYYYSIKDISVGGMCICYGHAKACPLIPNTKVSLIFILKHFSNQTFYYVCCLHWQHPHKTRTLLHFLFQLPTEESYNYFLKTS